MKKGSRAAVLRWTGKGLLWIGFWAEALAERDWVGVVDMEEVRPLSWVDGMNVCVR